MTEPLTVGLIAWTVILLIMADIALVWRLGQKATISWTLLTWRMAHPVALTSAFVLIGHLFFPQCAAAQGQVEAAGPILGTILGVIAIGCTAAFAFCLSNRGGMRPPYSPHYLAILALQAVAGVAIGHAVFPQYVVCG